MTRDVLNQDGTKLVEVNVSQSTSSSDTAKPLTRAEQLRLLGTSERYRSLFEIQPIPPDFRHLLAKIRDPKVWYEDAWRAAQGVLDFLVPDYTTDQSMDKAVLLALFTARKEAHDTVARTWAKKQDPIIILQELAAKRRRVFEKIEDPEKRLVYETFEDVFFTNGLFRR